MKRYSLEPYGMDHNEEGKFVTYHEALEMIKKAYRTGYNDATDRLIRIADESICRQNIDYVDGLDPEDLTDNV